MLGVWINVGDDQENRHTHHKVEYELVILMLIFIDKKKIENSQEHIWKPQKIRYDKKLAEWHPVIKNRVYNVITVNRPLLKISKQENINNGIG